MPTTSAATLPEQTPSLRDIIPVILAGGEGTRLRPLSRAAKPKPFLNLLSKQSLLQRTALRVTSMAAPAIICNATHRPLVIDQMQGCNIRPAQIFLEPQGRGTAPAIAVAAHYFGRTADPLLLVMPSDHEISDPDTFTAAVFQGIPAARAGRIVLFGITPRRPATGLGYIKCSLTDPNRVDSFVEKPDAVVAKRYLREGNYLWNSGIFLFSAKSFLERLRALDPALHDASYQSVARASRLRDGICLHEDSFASCPKISIDHAMIEKAGPDHLSVIPTDMEWSDIGTWRDLAAVAWRRIFA